MDVKKRFFPVTVEVKNLANSNFSESYLKTEAECYLSDLVEKHSRESIVYDKLPEGKFFESGGKTYLKLYSEQVYNFSDNCSDVFHSFNKKVFIVDVKMEFNYQYK